MPNLGVAAIVQKWLTKWQGAQTARINAWTSAPSWLAGATGVATTAGTMLTGASPVFDSAFSTLRQRVLGMHRDTAYSSIGRYNAGLASASLDFK